MLFSSGPSSNLSKLPDHRLAQCLIDQLDILLELREQCKSLMIFGLMVVLDEIAMNHSAVSQANAPRRGGP